MNDEPIVLINSFEVPAGQEDDFLRSWERARDVLMAKDGYQSSRLHQSVSPSADFRFVNVALWDSEGAFRAAIASPEFRSVRIPYRFRASTYEVVRADERWRPRSTASIGGDENRNRMPAA